MAIKRAIQGIKGAYDVMSHATAFNIISKSDYLQALPLLSHSTFLTTDFSVLHAYPCYVTLGLHTGAKTFLLSEMV